MGQLTNGGGSWHPKPHGQCHVPAMSIIVAVQGVVVVLNKNRVFKLFPQGFFINKKKRWPTISAIAISG